MLDNLNARSNRKSRRRESNLLRAALSALEGLEARQLLSLPPPAGWLNMDIGTATANPGNATYNAGTGVYTIQGSGDDIWNNADGFQYAYTPLVGDGPNNFLPRPVICARNVP